MESNWQATETESTNQAWLAVDAMLDEMSALAESEPALPSFYRGLLTRAIKVVSAKGGAVWIMEDGGFRLECEEGLVALGIATNSALYKSHERSLAAVVAAGSSAEFAHGDRASFALFPCRCEGKTFAVIEIIDAAGEYAQSESLTKLMDAVCEIACDFFRASQLHLLRDRQRLWSDLQEFTQLVHGSLRIQETAYAIANEGRRFIGCDRVTVLATRSGRSRVLSVSGIAQIERRTDQIRQLESLVAVIVRFGDPLTIPNDRANFPPEIERPLDDYLDVSHARLLRVLPITESADRDSSDERTDRSTIGAIVIEHFSADEPAGASDRVELVHQQSSLAFRNALEYSSLPLVAWARGIRRSIRRLHERRFAQVIVGFAMLAALTCALIFVPAELTIEADGSAEPATLRNVFAPADGEIVDVLIQHQQAVDAGQTLAEMHSADLALRHEEVLSARETTLEKLRGIESARLIDRTRTDRSGDNATMLSATEQELQKALASQNAQLAILQQEIDALQICSPFAGTVLTWNVAERLEGHPVNRGQKLMSVAKLDGEWQLELKILDRDIGHVLAARENVEQPLLVTFALATDVGRKHTARLREVSSTTEISDDSRVVVTARADIDDAATITLRPGATVIARVHCGKRSVGFVWLRDAIEFVQRHIIF